MLSCLPVSPFGDVLSTPDAIPSRNVSSLQDIIVAMLDVVNDRLNTHGSQIEGLQHFVKELQAGEELRVQRFEPPEQDNTFDLDEVPAEKVVCRYSELRRQLEETRAEVASLRADLELNASHPAATLSEPMEKVERISGTDLHLVTKFGHDECVHEGWPVSSSDSEHLSREMDAVDEEIQVELPLDSFTNEVDSPLPAPARPDDGQGRSSVYAEACASQEVIWNRSRNRRPAYGDLERDDRSQKFTRVANSEELRQSSYRRFVLQNRVRQFLAKSTGPQRLTAGALK